MEIRGIDVKLGFGQIEGALRRMHRVDDSRHARFRARLRYLQQRVDIGIPRGGGGRRANFAPEHALRFALALELEQTGLSPEQIATAFSGPLGRARSLLDLRPAIAAAIERLGTRRPAIMLWFTPEALRETTRDASHPNLAWASVTWADIEEISQDQFLASAASTRVSAINLCSLIAGLSANLGSDFVAATAAWASEQEAE